MKSLSKCKPTLFFPLTTGLIGLGLRIWLYVSQDDQGLLPQSHPALWLITALTILAVTGFICTARLYSRDGAYTDRFPPSVIGSIGTVLSSVGLGLFCLAEAKAALHGFLRISLPAGLLCTLALLFLGGSRWGRERPRFWVSCLPVVYLVLHTVSQCRTWGAEPQLHNYAFALLASLCLMLYSYHRCAVTLEKGNYRWLLFTGQAALYFCCLSLNTESMLFYLSFGLWLTTDFGTIHPQED